MPDQKSKNNNCDAFAKAYAFTRADEAAAIGMHPYFMPIAKQRGGTVKVKDKDLVILGSNDYLGLTQDERVKNAARNALGDFGTSCTGSRFLTGTLTLHEEIELRLAKFFNKESVLTFSAGYLGCLSVIAALAGRKDILYFDRENHSSLYDGATLSPAKLRKFKHNDLEQLEKMLIEDQDKNLGKIIVSDGVFSMSGHIANLPRLVELAKKYNAKLIIDDAHGAGVLGPNGEGTAAHFGLEDEVDLIVGTFSKSFASVGGYVAGKREVVSFIKHKARPFIFTAALPSMQMAAALEALNIIEKESKHKEKLWKNVKHYQEGMAALGFNTMGTQTPIVPVFIGEDEAALAFWKMLWEEGVFTTPAMSPAVPSGQSIIRTSVNANHSSEQIDKVLAAFGIVGKKLGIIS